MDNQNVSNNMTQQPVQYYGESDEQKTKRAGVFAFMWLPTILYAVFYTFCLYNNFHSITMPLFAAGTVVYCAYALKCFRGCRFKELKLQKMSCFCAIGMFLLAVSTSMTGNGFVILMNNTGIFCLLVSMLLFEFCTTRGWTLSKGVASVGKAVIGAVSSIEDPFRDFACFRTRKKNHRTRQVEYVLIGIAIAFPILIVVMILLVHADAVFGDLMLKIFHLDIAPEKVIGIVLTFVYAVFASYCGIRYLGKQSIEAASKDMRRWEPVIANTILALVSIVYLLFCFIQIFSLFLGQMQLPEGYTYAQYAREGFFQLLFVCLINVGLVLFMMGCFKENKIKKILLIVISACTYIMIASSAYRMCLYIREYHLTFLRVFVLWMLALIAVWLGGIIVQIYREGFPLFRYTIVIVTIFVFAFGIAKPDYWIAKYDVAHLTNPQDTYYLSGLSTDAAPAIAGHKGAWANYYWGNVSSEFDDDIREFNFSHAKARELYAKRR